VVICMAQKYSMFLKAKIRLRNEVEWSIQKRIGVGPLSDRVSGLFATNCGNLHESTHIGCMMKHRVIVYQEILVVEISLEVINIHLTIMLRIRLLKIFSFISF